ncbi:MAG: CDGSH iron-sulfur domain-containing protein [Gammaproteobacteria bacterium]|nr:CDGSH iron-sulfur domain-containing protein [Gammaproteobacteria bacterium]
MSKSKTKRFSGAHLNVSWDARLCIHVAECGNADDELFVAGRDPWCMPDKVADERVVEVCERCPSGALSVHDQSGASPERPPAANRVQVVNDGPLYVHGDLEPDGFAQDMPGTRYRVALCRCGQSNNKPFCDNSHRKAGFEDAGAIGESGPGSQGSGGKLRISPAEDGPLILSGKVELLAGSGRVAWRGDKVALCRCGESFNKPFCDGSHKRAGFRSGD